MDDQQRNELLRLARETAICALSKPGESVTTQLVLPPPAGGLFVTVRRGHRLRGCMGTFQPKPTLIETVDHVTRLACNDPRFVNDPIRVDELPDLRFEMSVLSPLRRTADPQSLRIGIDGLMIRRGKNTGCFLPSVAVDFGWSVETLLDECCTNKAGLPRGAWKESDTEVLLFTAEVFAEARSGG